MPQDNLFPHLWRGVCDAETARRAVWSQLTSPAALAARQAYVRDAITEMIGPWPARCELAPRVTRRLSRDDCDLELLLFDARPGWPVSATLWLPKHLDGPAPAVLFTCGHADNGRFDANYQRVQRALVRQGFVVLAYDPLGQGERHHYLDARGRPRLGGCVHEHVMVGRQLELLGYNLANLRIWDGMRALDYLLTRPEVDPARVGVTGNSGGGTLSAYLLAMDERLAAGASGCWVTSLVHRIATREAADSEQQFHPMLARGLDHPDLLLLAAPRPLMVLSARHDFFPLAGTQQTVAQLREAYGTLGAPEALGWTIADEHHGYTRPLREAAVRWFARWLQDRDEPYAEPDLPVEPDRELWATATGNVGGTHPHTLMLRDFPVPLACRGLAEPAPAVRTLLAELLGLDPLAARTPWPTPAGPASDDPRLVRLASDADVTLDAWLCEPAGETRQAVLLVAGEAGAEPVLAGRRLPALLAGGSRVLVLEPRGLGRGRSPLPAGFRPERYDHVYGIETDHNCTSWMLGRPLLGQRVFDVLCGLQWLSGARVPLAVEGEELGGLLALLAAALDERVTEVRAHRSLVSWRRLLETPIYDYRPHWWMPRALLQFDLPDIAATLAPRSLTLCETRDACRQPLAASEVAAEYALTTAAYERLGGTFRIL